MGNGKVAHHFVRQTDTMTYIKTFGLLLLKSRNSINLHLQEFGYDDGDCTTEFQCFMCSFKKYPKATLRGMCENRFTDKKYTLQFDESKNLPSFIVSLLKN